MSDLRSRLERIGDRARPAADAFAHLEWVRRRRERNRRIVAAIVAFVVAIAGSVAAFSVFRDGEPTLGDDALDGFSALWPESTYVDALAVQEAVDSGDRTLGWRLDAGETALAFARDALGWTDVSIDPDVAYAGAGTWIGVQTPPAPCPSPPTPGCSARDAFIGLRRLDGPNGIWSVVAVVDEFFEGPEAGSEIVVGTDLEIPTQFEQPTNLYVAFVGLGPCAGWEQDVIASAEPMITVTAPDLPEGHPDGCDIALIVMHNDASDHQMEGLGQQLLFYGYRTALFDVLAVPLRLVPPSGVSAPDVANVTCDGSEIAVDTSIVRAQRDGVHLMVSATGDTSFSIVQDAAAGGSADGDTSVSSGQGFGTEPGDTVIVAQTPPGRYLLSCAETPEGEGGTAGVAGAAPLEVVDPAGHYLPFEPECLGEGYGMAPGYAGGEVGDRGDPVDIARSRLTGLEEGDVVERAGYRQDASEPVIRIVRDGTVVGSVTLFDDGHGGWLLSSLEGCGGTAFGWSAEAAEPSPRAAVDCETGNIVALNAVPLELTLVVEGFRFDLDCVRVPAGERFTITLYNRDAGATHSVSIYPEGSDEAVFSGDICLGPGRFAYDVPALEAGAYRIVDLHSPQTQDVSLLVE